jgi:hypothetical protein
MLKDGEEFELNIGGREFTEDEKAQIERGDLPLSERIRIINEVDEKMHKGSMFNPAHDLSAHEELIRSKVAIPAPPSLPPMPVRAPDRSGIPASTSLAFVRERLERERKERGEEKKRLDDQLEKSRREALLEREKRMFAENLVRPAYTPYPSTVYSAYLPATYNRIYRWGVDLIPDYYTYQERKRLEDLLSKLIKRELEANKTESELESMIKDIIEGKSSLKTTETSKRKVSKKRVSRRKAPARKSKRKVSKKRVSRRKAPARKSKRKVSKK